MMTPLYRCLITGVFGAALALAAGCERQSPDAHTHAHGDDHGHDHDDGHDHAHDGGDGHDHAHAQAGGAMDDHALVPLGSVMLGDVSAEFSQGHGLVAAGKEMHLRVVLEPGDAGASEVRAWIGTQDRLASAVGRGEFAADGWYDLHAVAPDPLPAGAAWWVEVQRPDGSTEVGSVAFR